MIKILEKSISTAIGFHISGKVNENELKDVINYFELAICKHDKVSWLGIITNYKGFTLKAFVIDLKFNIKNLKHFEKKAVVTDNKVFKYLTKMLGPVFGIKYFKISEQKEAWSYIK